MVLGNVVARFEERLAAAGKPARAEYERAYMKSALRFHGVDQATIRRACGEFCKLHALDHEALVAVVDALYATDWFDLRSAAVDLLERKRKLVGPDDAAWLIALVRRSACWAHVDWIAAAPMLGEKEFFIRKAIGWVLRDTSRKRPELVRDFVAAQSDPDWAAYRSIVKMLATAPRPSAR